MKRLVMIAVSVTFLAYAPAFAAEKAKSPSPPRVPEMSAAGKVIEMTAERLRIERTLKGEAETMEFALEKKFDPIAVGEQVKVSYREKDGRFVLIRVAPAKITAVPKPKKQTPQAAKPAEDRGTQAGKQQR